MKGRFCIGVGRSPGLRPRPVDREGKSVLPNDQLILEGVN
jgi:hypothetical protein